MAPSAVGTSAAVARGETVTELDKAIWHVFGAKNGDHWFGSHERGAYRYDGKTLVRYTTKDGLGSDSIEGFQEDDAGNIFIAAGNRISRFDGRTLATLIESTTTTPDDWKLLPNDLWFRGPGDSASLLRYDGRSLHRLKIPETDAGRRIVAASPRDQFPNINFTPYDPYVIFEDSRGHLWFGTALLGACRFDGKSFAWIPEEDLHNGSFGTRSIVEDRHGRFWCSNVVDRYEVDTSDSAAPRFRKLKGLRDANRPDRVPFGGVMSAVKDENGAVWFATYGEGVFRYDGKDLVHYPVTVGGSAINLYLIHRDHQGVLWLGTQQHGAFRFNGKSFEPFKP
ncbi:MAG: hypothetical protein FJ253_05475 [Phycisphaerae bacterium]|nr:hypothetical protein [Phycisphaerae bacterium]